MPLPPGRGNCSVEGCERDIFTLRGWCEMHYQRWRKHGDPAHERPKADPGFCSTPGCDDPVRSSGMCAPCYHRSLYRLRRAAQGKPEPAPPNPTCGICGATFSRVGRQAYCDDRCARIARQGYYLERDYGLTREEFRALMERQGGLCAVCHQPDASVKAILHVDHCHETGKVRGLLCHRCNVGLGHFKDDPALLRAAANYLGD